MSKLLCRKLVNDFAAAMLAKMIANDHKPGWRQDDPRALLRRLDDEVAELRQAIIRAGTIEEILDVRGRWSRQDADGRRVTFRLGRMTAIDVAALEAIRGEAADVANFAMLIADRCNQLATAAPEQP